ncbi:UPF0182 family protein [bacterium]|nr:UPF0182 family protein [bacterium]
MMKNKGILVIIGLVMLCLLLLGDGIRLCVDWLWFQEINLEQVFTTTLLAKAQIGAIVGGLFFILLFVNLLIARLVINRRGPVIIDDDTLFEIPKMNEIMTNLNKILFWCAGIFSLLIGLGSTYKWDEFLKFFHPTSFNISDPLFSMDIGFYVFQLPLIKYLYSISISAVFFSSILVLIIYVLEKGIWLRKTGISVLPGARIHFTGLGILVALLVACGCLLKQFALLFSTRGVVFGASYTDIHAVFPVLNILILLSALLIIVLTLSIFTRIWKPIVVLVGLMILTGVIGMGFYPQIIQKLHVAPNEIALEDPFIKLNIAFTRKAYDVDKIEVKKFPLANVLTLADLKENDETIKNIRLWDHKPLLDAYSQLQEIRTYYKFNDVDNDRYMINGQYQQVMLSPREISSNNLSSKIWLNEHITYTHGYGLCLGPVNRVTEEGLPEFMIKDIPPVSTVDLKISRPEIYYGEIANDYCFVNTNAKEFDYPAGDENKYSVYQGTGGVKIESFFRKFLFSLHFAEPKILFSTDIVPQSRIMYYRDIKKRLNMAAPFISYDSDAYMVISKDGRLFWICDGYTMSNSYPYSEPISKVNYIRNSVKTIMDAYNGSIKFYVSDPDDPIIKCYEQIFPNMFQPLNSMPEDLREHLRYPETLLNIQSQIYCSYHMENPQVFYNKEDLWNIAKSSDDSVMSPYYTIMKLDDKNEFIMMMPFTPAKKDNLIAWIAARCDMPNYGKLMVYTFPKQIQVYGPTQIKARINQDTVISKELSLWNQMGSRVIHGNLLVIPVKNSLLYVEPLYLAAEKSKIPELKRVVVAFGNQIAMEQTMEQALMKIFGSGMARSTVTPPKGKEEISQGMSRDDLILQAAKCFRQAEGCLKNGDWVGYGEQWNGLKQTLNTLAEKK